jgi:hypothetical protein
MTKVASPRFLLLSSAGLRQDSVPQLPALPNDLGGGDCAGSEWLAVQEPAGVADTANVNIQT